MTSTKQARFTAHHGRRRWRRRTSRTAVAVAATVAVAVGGFATGSTTASTPSEPYRFVVSNNFIGNDWRPQVMHLAELTADLAPFEGRVELENVVAENTVEAQNQSLANIIQTEPDVIILIPASESAHDEVVQRACDRGIVVVAIDTPITAPCAYNVAQSMFNGQQVIGQWMAQTIGDGGTVLVDRGIPGLGVAETIRSGFLEGLGDGVEVVGEFDGEFAPGPEQQGISALLAATPDVDGIMTQGYCQPVFDALRQAGGIDVPATCFGYNGELTACAEADRKCAVMSGSPTIIQIAMETALALLDGDSDAQPGEIVPMPITVWITNPDDVELELTDDVTLEAFAEGENYFPDLPPGLAMPFTLDRYPITVEQALGN